jgi:hypothetical protein
MGTRGPLPTHASAAERQKAYRQRKAQQVQARQVVHVGPVWSSEDLDLARAVLGQIWDDDETTYDQVLELFVRAGLAKPPPVNLPTL